MAYADRNVSGNRVVAIVVVSVIVAVMGYAFVTGLTYKYVKAVSEKLKTFDVQEPPPPPPDVPPPPPPPDTPLPPPPVVSPPPIVRTNTPPPVVFTQPTPPPVFIPTPTAAPAPPAPPAPPKIAVKVSPKGNPASWFSTDDYPAAARRANAAGRVTVQLNIDASGRVEGCRVTSSSGNQDLDDTTCRLATRRGRFNPAKDANGVAQPSTTTIPGVRWSLQDE
jgi:protein TonB